MPAPSGFTLLETLAVLVLVAMIGAALVGSDRTLSASGRAQLAESMLREEVRRAAMLAERRGGATLKLGGRLTIRSDGRNLDPPPTLMPAGWSARIDGSEDAALVFDAWGRCRDCEVSLIGPSGAAGSWRLLGVSLQLDPDKGGSR